MIDKLKKYSQMINRDDGMDKRNSISLQKTYFVLLGMSLQRNPVTTQMINKFKFHLIKLE